MRDEIIRKATALFLKLGFKNITMDSLAKELSISKKTIYVHFKNKKELVIAGTDYLFNEISIGIDSIIALDRNPIDELYLIKAFVSTTLKKEISSPFFQLQNYYPDIYKLLINRQLKKMIECVKNNLQKGMKMSLYRNDLKVELVSRYFFTGILGVRDAEIFNPIHFNLEEVQNYYLDYFLKSILNQKGLTFLKEYQKNDLTNR